MYTSWVWMLWGNTFSDGSDGKESSCNAEELGSIPGSGRSLENGMAIVAVQSPSLSDSQWPHGLQHARPPWPSPSLRIGPSSCPLHRWCHTATSSSDTLFSFCPQSFLASGSFPVSQLFTSGGQNIGASASEWLPTLVFLPGESHGQRSLVG